MADSEEIIKLFRTTLRLFYKPGCVILYDILLENHALKEEELVSRLNIVPKEVNKHMFALKNDRLIKQESVEENEMATTYFYIDYYEAYLIIKYRIFSMMKRLEREMREQRSEPVFYCSECDTNFNLLEIQETMTDYKFYCKTCNGPLEDRMVNRHSHEKYKRFAKKLAVIFEILQKLEGKKIQQVDLKAALENKKSNQKIFHRKREQPVEEENDFEEIQFTAKSEENIETKKEKKTFLYKGEQRNIEDITDDDLDNMTESEYERYFEVYNE